MAPIHFVKLEDMQATNILFGLLFTGQVYNDIQIHKDTPIKEIKGCGSYIGDSMQAVFETAYDAGKLYGSFVAQRHGSFNPAKLDLSFEKPCDRIPMFANGFLYKVLPLEEQDIQEFDKGTLEHAMMVDKIEK